MIFPSIVKPLRIVSLISDVLHIGLTLFSDEICHGGLVHLPLLESFEAESGDFTMSLRHTTTTKLVALKHTTHLLQVTHTSK